MSEDRTHEAEAAVGYVFADRTLLLTALTHPSYAAEHQSTDDYDRLEFLGDAILGFVVSSHLYDAFPSEPEGDLTRRKHYAVAGDALVEAAEALGLGRFVLLGVGAHAAGERRRASILENTIEALIGAIYLDGGLDAARAFTLRVLAPRLSVGQVPDVDAKGALQQWTQATRGLLPVYRMTAVEGPIHARTFAAEVVVDGVVLGVGAGPTKQAAEKAAAAAALETLTGPRG